MSYIHRTNTYQEYNIGTSYTHITQADFNGSLPNPLISRINPVQIKRNIKNEIITTICHAILKSPCEGPNGEIWEPIATLYNTLKTDSMPELGEKQCRRKIWQLNIKTPKTTETKSLKRLARWKAVAQIWLTQQRQIQLSESQSPIASDEPVKRSNESPINSPLKKRKISASNPRSNKDTEEIITILCQAVLQSTVEKLKGQIWENISDLYNKLKTDSMPYLDNQKCCNKMWHLKNTIIIPKNLPQKGLGLWQPVARIWLTQNQIKLPENSAQQTDDVFDEQSESSNETKQDSMSNLDSQKLNDMSETNEISDLAGLNLRHTIEQIELTNQSQIRFSENSAQTTIDPDETINWKKLYEGFNITLHDAS